MVAREFCFNWDYGGQGIRSFAHLLKITHFDEQLWAICSDRSGQMSDCERIAQVSHDKEATVSESLRSLMTKEQHKRFAQGAHDKRANKRIPWFFWANHSFAFLLTKNEQFAQKKLTKIVFLCIF